MVISKILCILNIDSELKGQLEIEYFIFPH